MGNRTLSLSLVLRALFLDTSAYTAMRDDDNPFVEGAFLVVMVGALTALLSLVGQLIAWASTPSLAAIRDIILDVYRHQPFWAAITANPQAQAIFNFSWDLLWRVIPPLFGAPNPATAALNILAWPVLGLLGWLIYGLLAFGFARWLRGTGTLNQTLGTTALAVSPLLLRGLGVIPFLAVGAVLNTWQLVCRYKALRAVHRLSWQRTVWATILPFAVYLLFWLLIAVAGAAVIAAVVGR